MRRILAFVSSLCVVATIVACVGDSPNVAGNDSGADTAVLDAATVDVANEATADAGDGATAACDLTKPFGTPAQVPGISGSSGSVRLGSDYLDAYFQGVIDGGVGSNDIYTIHRADLQSPFVGAQPLAVLNTAFDDTSPSVSGDGKFIAFCSSRSNPPWDLYSATRASTDAVFYQLIPLATLNTTSLECDTFVREDGQALYFRRTGAKGDLFRAPLGGSGFANAVALAELNTVSNEVSPVVTPDDLTIFYASDRGDGGASGALDIWTARRAKATDPFGTPTNVAELNTTEGESPSFVTRDGCTLFFDRTGAGSPLFATRPR
ncbi:hypothetical protein BH09MYX1_BH09MYX1_08560 [soil metagenome]